MKDVYSYVSTRTGCDPVPTLFLCAPSEAVTTLPEAEQYAESSGWKQQAEAMAAVLLVPVPDPSWEEESTDLLFDLYLQRKGSFRAPSGESIPGRDGALWLWETVIYGVGYGDGARFLGNSVVAHPNFFAATALIGKGADRMGPGEELSDHWLVPAPKDYGVRNREVPVAMDLYGKELSLDRTEEYFLSAGPEARIRRFPEIDVYAETIVETLFATTIRWKNSPDGTLATYCGRKSFEEEGRYHHRVVSSETQEYPYAWYLPEGTSENGRKDLSVVFNIHGRGEPAWMFAEKNGWQDLADETGEFLVVTPDSAGNIWTIDRDYDALALILQDLAGQVDFDEERVYVTGFSNGAVFTAQQATTHPELFAAVSPWNGPFIDRFVYEPGFPETGYIMPCFVMLGDSDEKASWDCPERLAELELLRTADHCLPEPAEHLCHGRFDTTLYKNEEGVPLLGFTVMKNMPHGAIVEQSRAAWDFMKRFRRPKGQKEVCYERDSV